MIIPDKKLNQQNLKKFFERKKKYPKNVLCVLLLTNYYSKTFRVSYILRKKMKEFNIDSFKYALQQKKKN